MNHYEIGDSMNYKNHHIMNDDLPLFSAMILGKLSYFTHLK